MTTECITFFVDGIPAPQGSKRAFVVAGRARIVEDCKRTKPWRERILWTAREFAPEVPWTGPIGLRLSFSLRRPATVPHERRGYPAAKPDDDKLLRAVSDALSGVIYADDAQRCETHVTKVYSQRPGVLIEVWQMPCEHAAGYMRDGRCRDCGEVLR